MSEHKSFFDAELGYTWTPDALACENDIHKAIKPIFEMWMKLGYSPREIAGLMHHGASSLECEMVMDLRCNRFDANKR